MFHPSEGRAITGAMRVMSADSPIETDKRRIAANMKTSYLKSRLCSAGPKLCAACGLCDFGKEYVMRERQKAENARKTA